MSPAPRRQVGWDVAIGLELAREEAVDRRMRAILDRPDFPAFSQHIYELLRKTGDEEGSLRHVTNVILKDYAVSLKILRTANSPFYNRSGKPILSITHAVALLGLETIGNLAGSMLLFEHFHHRSPGLKQLMLLSLLTANHVREMGARLAYPRLEEAYLCGMFRNLGEVLVACYFPREYAGILRELEQNKLAERHAVRKVIGCTYEHLGRAAARHWHMPEPVSASMDEAETPPTRIPETEREMLTCLTGFGQALTAAIYRAEPRGARARFRLVEEKYGPLLAFTPKDLREVADRAVAETRDVFTSLHIPLDDLRLRKQVEAATAVAVEPYPEAPAGLDGDGTLLERLAEEVSATIESHPDFDLNAVLLMVLEAVLRGGPFDRVVFALVNPEQQQVTGRLGLGPGAEELIDKFRFPLTARGGPIAATMLRKQDLWVYGQRDGRFENSTFARVLAAESFAVLPVVVDGLAVGCLYAERAAPEPLARRAQDLLLSLRDCAALAIRRKRLAAVR